MVGESIRSNRMTLFWGLLVIAMGVAIVSYAFNPSLRLSAGIFLLGTGLAAIVIGTLRTRARGTLIAGGLLALAGGLLIVTWVTTVNAWLLLGTVVLLLGALIIIAFWRRDRFV